MLKLSKFLIEKRLRLIDMFRILDKKQTLKMEKDEFIKRLKVELLFFWSIYKTNTLFILKDIRATFKEQRHFFNCRYSINWKCD
jgi:hypothetical protein